MYMWPQYLHHCISAEIGKKWVLVKHNYGVSSVLASNDAWVGVIVVAYNWRVEGIKMS